MRTTFKKTLAAVSAATVVAASAAVMAVPASAASSISVGTVELTLEELAAADYTVEVPITAGASFNNLAFGITLDDGLTFVQGSNTAGGLCAAVANGQFVWFPVTAMTAIDGASAGSITVTVESSATEGSTYKLSATTKDADGNDAAVLDDASPSVSSGSIVIKAGETEAPTATPTTAATEAPAAEATATTKTTSGSPATGDALPIAGVGVAVAVIGGVALVSKKRK